MARTLPFPRLRIAAFVALVIALSLAAVASLAVARVDQTLPTRSGQIALGALSAPVEVLRDANGVPQLYADTSEDLFTAQGYVHAQERFWEMDVRRHITAGRLSELFGASQVETDAYIRTMGWRRVAEQEVALLSQENRRLLDAYADGVNAYLQQTDTQSLSLEYSVLGLTGSVERPQPWTPADSLAWLKAMAWDLGGNLQQEVDLALVGDAVGAERAAELFPAYDDQAYEPIVRQGGVRGGRFAPAAGVNRALPAQVSAALSSARRATEAIPALVGEPGEGIGSNAWAISGEHTASGAAILSNDPHLATSIPSIFMQVGLHCRTVTKACPYDVSGFSFSGLPGVVIGHNAAIAWGFTNPYIDTQDLFVEELRGDAVRRGDIWVPMQVRREEIRVHGEAQPRELYVRESSHGPLLSDVDGQLGRVAERSGQQFAVALQWTALTPTPSFEALVELNRAANVTEFRRAAEQLRAPSQNLVYADVEGNIGYQLPGDVPMRQGRDGRRPARGWASEDAWSGMIPFAELPHLENPPEGLIVTANQRIIGDAYPHVLGSDSSYGWRSQRIRDLMQGRDGVTLDQAEAVFYDTEVTYAEAILPALLRSRELEPWVADGKRVLREWDRRAQADSPGAAYFYLVIDNLLAKTFDDELPEGVVAESGDRWYRVLGELMTRADDPWWDNADTPVRETRDDIVAEAMLGARREITARMSREPEGWQWGKLHTLSLTHQTLGTSGVAPVEALFNRGHFASGGGPAVVDAMSFRSVENNNLQVTNAPAMRMLVDLGSLDESRWINQSGTSGHAFEPTYDDQLALWATNRMLPFRYSRAAVEAASTQRIILAPTS